MSDSFLGEVRILPYTFAPVNWAYCDGQICPISQNSALFSILSDTYGGDGRTNFALPNLQGRVPMHPGYGPGLTPHRVGEDGGIDRLSLTEDFLPSHNHSAIFCMIAASKLEPTNNYISVETDPTINSWLRGGQGLDALTSMSYLSLKKAGSSAPHENQQPYLVMSFCICMDGIYPSRN